MWIDFRYIDGRAIAEFFIVFAITFLIGAIRILQEASQGQNSEDKQRINQIVTEVTKYELVTVACAFWITKERDAISNKLIDRCWWYAIGFNKARIYVIPIQISDDSPERITYQDYFIIEPEQLRLVNGKKGGNWVEFYDKEGQKLVSLRVWNLSPNSEPKMLITQREAAKNWKTEFVPYWMKKVNTANGTNATGRYNDKK